MQGVADGHKSGIGHPSEEKSVHTSKNYKEIHLSDAACIGDGFAPCLDVHQHLRDCGGDKTYVSKGQVGEEEVHWGVEVGVTADGQDDEQVLKYGDQVHGQEQTKEKGMRH